MFKKKPGQKRSKNCKNFRKRSKVDGFWLFFDSFWPVWLFFLNTVTQCDKHFFLLNTVTQCDKLFFPKHSNSVWQTFFHRIGPLGRFDLVVAMSMCLCVSLCVCLMSLFMWYILRFILPPLPEVGSPQFLEIRNPCGKVLERNGPRIEHFFWDVV